jgi:hypothetical protein
MKARMTTLALALTLAATAVAAPPPTPPSPKSTGTPPVGSQPPSTPTPGGQSVGGNSAPLSADQLKVLDEALSKANAIVVDVESMTKGDGTGCPASFTVREYMEDLRAKRTSKQTGDDLVDQDSGRKEDGGAKLEWQFYYLCEALATKNVAACAEAGSVTPKTLNRNTSMKAGLQDPNAITDDAALQMQQSQSYEGKCSNSFYQERTRGAFIGKSPQFMELCKQSLSHMTPLKSPASAEPICSAWQAYNGDPQPFVNAIQAGVAHPLKREYALGIVSEMTVAPGVCSGLEREYYRRLCREQEDYRKALTTKNASACRGGICRVLMGEGLVACESYARKFKAGACTQHYAADFVEAREKDFKRYADQVEGFLSSADSGIGDPKQLKEFNARLDKLYELRDRFDRAADAVAPKSAPRKVPAPATKKG